MKKLLLFVGIFFIVTSHFNTQAMVVSDLVAKGIAVGTGVATSGGMMLLLSQPHVAAIALPGFVFGGLSYLGLREYTPDYLLHRANQTKKELKKSKIGLLFNMSQELTIENINGISKQACNDAFAEADYYEARLQKHREWLGLLKEKEYGNVLLQKSDNNNANAKYLDALAKKKLFKQYRARIHKIRSLLNSMENDKNYDKQLSRQSDEDKRKLETKQVNNEEIRANAKKIEANAKLRAVYLEISEWGYEKFILAPITLFVFLWSLKLLPYPSF